MRQPANAKQAINFVASNFNIVSPIGGWNVIDSLANMPATDALFLDNFWPTPTSVRLRKGWVEYASLEVDNPSIQAHDIRGLLSYSSPNGMKRLFACDQTGIYDITEGEHITIDPAPSTNGAWRGISVSNAAGNFLFAFNGVDKAQLFNGSTWTTIDAVSSPPLTDLDSSSIVNATVFKSRVFLVIVESLSFYYLGVNAISGKVTEYPLGAIFDKGGTLIACETWSLDSGEGIDDYIIFITSEGEVAVYQGTDPSSALNWALVGVYYIGRPLSYSCATKVGGDLLLLTVQGVYPLSKALQSATTNKQIATSYKIQPAFDFYVSNGEGFYGWQILFYPGATMLLVNVPFKRDDPNNFLYSYQFAMNTTHNSWCRFTGMASEVWGIFDNRLFFAKHNIVYEALVGDKDGSNPIRGKAKQAFNTLGSSQYNKHVKLVKPIIEVNGGMGLKLGFDVDFKVDTALNTHSTNTFADSISYWDQDIWDNAVWTGNLINANWVTIPNNVGMWFSLNLAIETKDATISWISTQYSTISGGYI